MTIPPSYLLWRPVHATEEPRTNAHGSSTQPDEQTGTGAETEQLNSVPPGASPSHVDPSIDRWQLRLNATQVVVGVIGPLIVLATLRFQFDDHHMNMINLESSERSALKDFLGPLQCHDSENSATTFHWCKHGYKVPCLVLDQATRCFNKPFPAPPISLSTSRRQRAIIAASMDLRYEPFIAIGLPSATALFLLLGTIFFKALRTD
jgi:hypothetical protein